MAKLVSKIYGDALFEVALEDNTMEELFYEVKELKKVLQENVDLSRIINHPKIARSEKIQMIEKIFRGRYKDSLVGFLVIVIDKGRYEELPSIFKYFMDRVREHKKIGVVWVTSAIDLSKKQQKMLEQKILATTEYETLKIHYKVDKSIIGGLIIRIKDRVVDNSIKSQLKAMTKALV